MAADKSCNICDKKVLRHSYHRRCTLCKSLVHIKCLPRVTKEDSIYTLRDDDDWYCSMCTEYIFPFNHIFTDDDFMASLSEYWDQSNIISFESLQNGNIFQ